MRPRTMLLLLALTLGACADDPAEPRTPGGGGPVGDDPGDDVPGDTTYDPPYARVISGEAVDRIP